MFIKLKKHGTQTEVRVNPDHIDFLQEIITKRGDGLIKNGTMLFFSNQENPLSVREHPDQIEDLIESEFQRTRVDRIYKVMDQYVDKLRSILGIPAL